MKLQHATDESLAYLMHQRGCSPFTIASYKSDLKQFLKFLAQRGVPPKVQTLTSSAAQRVVCLLAAQALSELLNWPRVSYVKGVNS